MKNTLLAGCALAIFGLTALAAEEAKFSAKCPVSGQAAKEDQSVDYKGAKVYFCCENCPKAFAKETDKYSTKANHQLVATGQAKAVKCPLTGRPLNSAQTVEVDGV